MPVPERAYKSAQYLANRVDEREQPCPHCLGQGIRLPECVYQRSESECPFCFGLGVDPESYVRKDSAA
jgi:DnaJ-class molecular chaperone